MRLRGSNVTASSVFFGSPRSVTSGSTTSTGATAATVLSTLDVGATARTSTGSTSTEATALSARGNVILVIVFLLDSNEAFLIGAVLAEELTSTATAASASASATASAAALSLALLSKKSGVLAALILDIGDSLLPASSLLLFLNFVGLGSLSLLFVLSSDSLGGLALKVQEGLALAARESSDEGVHF